MLFTGDDILKEVTAAQNASQEERPRSYLGMSSIGYKCQRAIWFNWRWFSPEIFVPRMLRLFSRGHRTEQPIVDILRLIGIRVEDVDPETGDQWEFIAKNGHVKGHCDGKGFLSAKKFIIEIKTHNQASFAKVTKGRNLKLSKFEHFAQIQRYMVEAKLDLGLYCATNKNTDQLYFEVVKEDRAVQAWLLERETFLLEATTVPSGTSEVDTFWICKMCWFSSICYRSGEVLVNCRTCTKSRLADKGCWSCSKKESGNTLTLREQLTGCRKHSPFSLR